MAGGFSEISLAMFTAFSPAGAVAFALVAVYLLAHRGMPRAEWDRLSHALLVPLGVVWIGFMASATHLGTPANALHAFAGIGRSPLSNEVMCSVAFLFVAGVYWLYSFKLKYVRGLMYVLLTGSICACAAMLWFMAFAYSVPTVPSWNTWHTPLNLLLSAAVGGMALGSLMLSIFSSSAGSWAKALRRMSYGALAASTALLAMHERFLAGVSNNVAAASEAVPWYGAAIVLYALMVVAGLILQARSEKCARWRRYVLVSSGCVLVFAALLLARLPFYFAYLSVGF